MEKTRVSKLVKGDKLSRISFMEVVSTDALYIRVKNEDDYEWSIANGIVAEECYSTKMDEEKKVSRTELAELLMNARDAVVVVNFNKQANADTVHAKLEEADGQKVTKKLLGNLLKGEERTMTGYVIGAEPVLGRTVMIDLEGKKSLKPTKEEGVLWDSRQRLVDHRTLNFVVYKNVKYTVK